MAKNDTDVHAHGIALGEFLLGHLNEAGQMAPVPSLGLPGEAGGNLFGKNGTYLVYRQMEQDPKALWDFCISLNPDVPHRISSWMVGRWPNGTPLMESPDSEAEANDTSNFQYRDDPFGRKCPIGSHIRRANPRDGLRNLEDPPSSSEADESLRLTQHHRILRRGRMYGPLWRPDPGEAYTPTPRGLSFLALNADIQGQFEMVQETWVNSPKFLGLYDEVDPLVGMTDPAGCPMSIPRAGQARMRIPDIPRFVTVRGGAYFFMPSLSAIQLLCDA
jgi:deferrochelatase/peroxidase EfeB